MKNERELLNPSDTDGREIDESLGTLTGEAAGLKVKDVGGAYPSSKEPWGKVPAETTSGESPTYYDRPLLKEPVWKWMVPTYFYLGGVAGASAAVGASALVAGGGQMRGLSVKARWLALGALVPGTACLISDLGRPERFLNMLRVFRPGSPMNLGSWLLTGAGSLTGVAAMGLGPFRRVGDAAAMGAGLLGIPLAGYTAVLLAHSSVPLWAASRRTLPVAFTGSALASAAALLELFSLNASEKRAVRRLGDVGKVLELAASFALMKEAGRPERVTRPLRQGFSGALWRLASTCTAASLALSVMPSKAGWKHRAAAVLATAGSLALRFGIFQAGKKSARDPRAAFEQQREGHPSETLTESQKKVHLGERGLPASLPTPEVMPQDRVEAGLE